MQFIDLHAQQNCIKADLDTRIATVLAHGKYIMGPEVRELEGKLADHCGARFALGCANGTDALQLALMAFGIGVGDAVFVPAFSFAASAEVVLLLGATPVFVDIDQNSYNLCVKSLLRALSQAKDLGLEPKVVMPVDLFGLPADYPAIRSVAEAHNLRILCDSAQGWGGTRDGQMTGTFGDITTTSFFPAKPLGCYGDGGALFTDDDDLASLLDSLRVHGKGSDKYDNVRAGLNSRLDTLQAAILLEKLVVFPAEVRARQQVAERYTAALNMHYFTPDVPAVCQSVWAQYTLRVKNEAIRTAVISYLKGADIPTVVYYPKPLHAQTAFAHCPRDPEGLKNSEHSARTVFSVPMGPYLTETDQNSVIGALLAAAHNAEAAL